MPALLIINYSIDDPDTFGDYQAAAGPALKIGSECELVAIDATSDRICLLYTSPSPRDPE